MSRYSDQPDSSSNRSDTASGGSYADRYRVDGDFSSSEFMAQQQQARFSDFGSSPGNGGSFGTASSNSSSGGGRPVALGNETSSRSSRKNVPITKRLESMIGRACSPVLHEPNLALNLEIADIINQKKGTCPRIAATSISKLINNRDPHIAILALSVLDICVKNCGYAFHLQISRKEFLNELVRRFPERPPVAYTRVQSLILQAIQEWWETICCTSKYKDDLGYIRDMHRLLTRKGYIFPEISASEAAVLNPAENLQSASELEKEERDAQEAKLQELIRRGTPADLQEANRLMKVMAGFQGDKKSDYRAKVAEEVDKLRRKAEILDEMLTNLSPGEEEDALPMDDDDDNVFSDIATSLKTSLPKLKSLAQEESEDEEAVARLLGLNDYVQSLLEKYQFLKQREWQKAANVHIARPANVEITKGELVAPEKSISLIDFDDDTNDGEEQSGPNSGQKHMAGSLDLLSELSLGGSGNGNSSVSNTTMNSSSAKSKQDILAAFGSPSSSTAPSFAQNNLLFDMSSSPTSSSSGSKPAAASNRTSGNDLDLLGAFSSPSQSATTTHTASAPSSAISDSDEWNFAYAAPPTTASSPSPLPFMLFDDGTLSVTGTVIRSNNKTPSSTSQQPRGVDITLSFSNKSQSSAISNLNIQLAVKRDLSIMVDALSSTYLDKGVQSGVWQHTVVDGVLENSSVKLRWIVTYQLNGHVFNKDGVANLPAV